MHLLPGDRLWDRYRVEDVAVSRCEGAWLTPIGDTNAGVERYLLVPLDERSIHPLTPLLSAAARIMRMKPPLPPAINPGKGGRGNGRARSQRQSLARNRGSDRQERNGGFELIPLLGSIEWVGEPEYGGVGVLAAPAASSLVELHRKAGSLTAAQTLPILFELVRSLDALSTLFGCASGRPADCDDVLRSACRLLNPDSIALRAGDGRPIWKAALPEKANGVHNPAPAWSAWSDFLAPELYTDPRITSAALVFSAAHIGAYLLGCARAEPPRSARISDVSLASVRDAAGVSDETAWAEIAGWASGKRDPSREFIRNAQAAGLPKELTNLLARCLSRRAGRRLPNPGKLMAALRKLSDSAWAKMENTCAGCNIQIEPVRLESGKTVCPICATEASAQNSTSSRGEGERGSVRGSRRSTTATALAKRSAGTSAVAAAVAAPAGMTMVASGSFLSGERKIPRTLRTFAIDTTPVTENEYKRYLSEINAQPRENGPGSREPRFDNFPATGVTWYEANEFAEHHGKRLPTVYEWEKAARGSDGRKFPYGNSYKANCGRLRVNTEPGERGATAVGSFPSGASASGALDMAGNVLEWTCTARRAGERIFRAVKGACYLDGSPELSRCTSVQYFRPEAFEPYLGFRCVKDIE